MQLFGIDPSQGLLDLARKTIPEATLQQGSGENLPLADNSVDLVIATGIMHHVDNPSLVVAEMFRVTRKAIIISDHNNFAFGNLAIRRIRMALYTCGLLTLATYLKQGFRKQGYSEDDGWWYPYSLFNNHGDIARFSDAWYLIPTRTPNTDRMNNLLFTQSHLAVFAFKR
jgi:SAM-dependent methyltransferase